VKCPNCRARLKHDLHEDVYYCTVCLWDEVLDGMEWSA
jgi:hypothetical protein